MKNNKELEKRAKKIEDRLEKLEFYYNKVPCHINIQDKDFVWCSEPYCKFIHYSELAEKAKKEWLQKIKQELEQYKPKKAQ